MSRLMPSRESDTSAASLRDRTYRSVLEHKGAVSKAISDKETGRIQATVAMIPSDVITILEVGCGDGRILAALPRRFKSIGVDYSHSTMTHFVNTGACATSENLPFKDQSIDLVMCCEVLEHLPDDMFENTARELERVARKYVLISVPYKENLRSRHIKCPSCSSVFHLWGHLRSFSNGHLNRLSSRLEAISTGYFGKRPPYRNGFICYLNQRFGHRWAAADKSTICPNCGNTTFARPPRNLITTICGALHLLTSTLTRVPDRNWVLKLYGRSR